MTTCPSCGQRAFSPWQKLLIGYGRLRACDHCGASLGLSSSVATSIYAGLLTMIQAFRTDNGWAAAAWLGVAAFLTCAITIAWVPLWQVIPAGEPRSTR
jgi:hypothetical protein